MRRRYLAGVLQRDQAGVGQGEPAGVEVEPAQVVLEVDVQPLAAGRPRPGHRHLDQPGPDPAPPRPGRDHGIEHERVHHPVPGHVHEPDQPGPVAGAHPSQAVPLDLPPPVPLVVAQHRVAEALGMQGVGLGAGERPAPFVGDRYRGRSCGGPEKRIEGAGMGELFSVEGKTAVVTGGSRGIGLMIARGLVEGGARVYVSSRKAEVCRQVAEELSRAGECLAVPADLSDEEGCRRLAAEVGERQGRLQVLVNNAGATWGAPLEDYPAAAWDKVLDLNLKAPFFLTRAMLPLLEAGAAPGDPARVINVGSIDGLRIPPMPTYAYSASKAGLHHLTRVLARELGPRGITVNAIAPGPFESKMMAETLRRFGDQIAAAAPLGRIGRPEDMAGAALYLASRAGAYVTGAVLPVDGGLTTL